MAEQYKSPGWYPDPDGKPGERWWNGAGWIDTHRGGAAPVAQSMAAPRPNPYLPPPAPASPIARSAFTIDARQNRFAVIAFVLGLVGMFGLSIAGLPAIVLGFMGIARARKLKAEGAQSNASLVFAVVGVAAGVIATLIFIVATLGLVAATTLTYN